MNINGNDLEKKSPFSFSRKKRETEKARRGLGFKELRN